MACSLEGAASYHFLLNEIKNTHQNTIKKPDSLEDDDKCRFQIFWSNTTLNI